METDNIGIDVMACGRSIACFLLVLLISSCSYRPVRFADRAPATSAHDDEPIAKPRPRTFLEELYQADVYVRREIIGGLDPRRPDDAGDVNAIDELVQSSWHHGSISSLRARYRRSGPPQTPWRRIAPPEHYTFVHSIVDRRGIQYQLLSDPPDRQGMRTGSAAIISRLLHLLGYHTPEVWIITDQNDQRLAAVRWPIGEDLGPSMISSPRPDDPNDVLQARDRRSLRALHLIAAWLNMTELVPTDLRDAYLGKAPEGHVQHYLLQWGGALGVDAYLRAKEFAQDPDREHKNFFLRLFSMGLSPKPPPIVPQTLWPSVGLLGSHVNPEQFSVSPPFAPFDKRQAPDVYWAAKQMSNLSTAELAAAIQAGKWSPAPQNWLFQILLLRRKQVVAYGFAQTTPCELLSLDNKDTGTVLRVVDLAITRGYAQNDTAKYAVRFLDDQGTETAPSLFLRPNEGTVVVPLPSMLHQQTYSVIQVTSRHGAYLAPRSFEVHLKPAQQKLKLLGVRH